MIEVYKSTISDENKVAESGALINGQRESEIKQSGKYLIVVKSGAEFHLKNAFF